MGWGDGQAVGGNQPPKGTEETPRSRWGPAKVDPGDLQHQQPVQSWEVPSKAEMGL